MIAANISSRSVEPKLKRVVLRYSASRTPPSEASAADATHTRLMTDSTLIPVAAASAGLSETARVARPRRVRASVNATAASTTSAIATEISDWAEICTGPSCMRCEIPDTIGAGWAPKKNRNADSSARDRPIVTIICCVMPTPRRRSGANRSVLSSQPARPPAAVATTIASHSGRCHHCTAMNAVMPPSVTSSPCAKFDSPVVP